MVVVETSTYSISGQTANSDFTASFTCLEKGFLSQIPVHCSGDRLCRVRVIQNSVTLADKTSTTSTEDLAFISSDYSSHLDPSVSSGTFTVQWTQTGGTIGDLLIQTNTVSESSLNGFSYTSQSMSGSSGNTPRSFKYTIDDPIVIPNAATVTVALPVQVEDVIITPSTLTNNITINSASILKESKGVDFVGTGGISSRFIKTNWPNQEGLTFRTTKQKEDWILEPEQSLLTKSDRERLS